jgi:hypothetical protein
MAIEQEHGDLAGRLRMDIASLAKKALDFVVADASLFLWKADARADRS